MTMKNTMMIYDVLDIQFYCVMSRYLSNLKLEAYAWLRFVETCGDGSSFRAAEIVEFLWDQPPG